MKKMFLGMLALLVWGVASVHAQVTIGSEAPPTPGAVLDLQSGGSQGLLMPPLGVSSIATSGKKQASTLATKRSFVDKKGNELKNEQI